MFARRPETLRAIETRDARRRFHAGTPSPTAVGDAHAGEEEEIRRTVTSPGWNLLRKELGLEAHRQYEALLSGEAVGEEAEKIRQRMIRLHAIEWITRRVLGDENNHKEST